MSYAAIAAAVVSAVASAAAGAVGAAQSANAASAQARYQSRVAQANQKIAAWQADDAMQRGALQEQRQRLQAAGLKGTQRTVLASRGLDLGEGSPLDILTGTDLIGEQDALTIRTNALRDAWGFKTQGMNYQAQSGLYQGAADQAGASKALGITTSLLGGASSVASSWNRYKATS